jgi:hypothetical protein
VAGTYLLQTHCSLNEIDVELFIFREIVEPFGELLELLLGHFRNSLVVFVSLFLGVEFSQQVINPVHSRPLSRRRYITDVCADRLRYAFTLPDENILYRHPQCVKLTHFS